MPKNITIILDPAHGSNVKGKCSPDYKHKEYVWSRDRVASLQSKLSDLGYGVFRTTYDATEPGLSYRVKVADSIAKCQTRKSLLITLHNNGAGNGMEWLNARGFEVYTTKGVTNSDKCADIIIEQLREDFPDIPARINKEKDLEKDKEQNFTVLMGKYYMAVYIEWLFQDNKEDVALLMDAATNSKFEDSLIKAIEKINSQFS